MHGARVQEMSISKRRKINGSVCLGTGTRFTWRVLQTTGGRYA